MAEVSEEINRSNTICHYKRFSGFLRANCNACRVGFPKMVGLLHLFAEYGLTVPVLFVDTPPPEKFHGQIRTGTRRPDCLGPSNGRACTPRCLWKLLTAWCLHGRIGDFVVTTPEGER